MVTLSSHALCRVCIFVCFLKLPVGVLNKPAYAGLKCTCFMTGYTQDRDRGTQDRDRHTQDRDTTPGSLHGGLPMYPSKGVTLKLSSCYT